jgi:hypothetical protein
MDIDHIQVRFASFATELLIESQGPNRGGLLLGQPGSCSLPSVVNQLTDRSKRQRSSHQFLQAGLDLPIAGMGFDQQSEHFSLEGTLRVLWLWSWYEHILQGLFCFLLPTVQGLTRNVMVSAQLAHQPMTGWRGQQLSYPSNSLLCCATMLHSSSLSTVDVVFSTVSLGEIFCTLFTTCHILLRFFEPCLNTGILPRRHLYFSLFLCIFLFHTIPASRRVLCA